MEQKFRKVLKRVRWAIAQIPLWYKTHGAEKTKQAFSREIAECYKLFGKEEEDGILKMIFSDVEQASLIPTPSGLTFFVINKAFLTEGLPEQYRRTGVIVKVFTNPDRANSYLRNLLIDQFRWSSVVMAKEYGVPPDVITYRSHEAETQFLQSPFFIPEWLRWKFKVSYPAPGDPALNPKQERLEFYRKF